jgi:hypothetical protein
MAAGGAPVAPARDDVTVDPDDLYGLPLESFVAERGALARALRGEGRRAEAAAVAGLRKPSVAAWAVNQVVRTQEPDLRALLEAGAAVRDAQAALLAGRADGRALRAATDAERAAVDRLVVAAGGLLSAEGHELSAAIIDRVADTLHAAALDEDARREVEGGRLARELRHVGLGAGLLAAPPPPPPPPPRWRPGPAPPAAKPAPGPRRAGRRAAKDQVEPDAEAAARATQAAAAERAEAERAEHERAEHERGIAEAIARTASVGARRLAERSDRALRSAEERRERAARALGEADVALAEAQARAEAAAAARQEADAEVERLRGGGGPTPRRRPRRA